MTSSVEAVSVVASEEASVVCLEAFSVEVVLETSVILVVVVSLSNSLVFHRWVAQALLQLKHKPL